MGQWDMAYSTIYSLGGINVAGIFDINAQWHRAKDSAVFAGHVQEVL